MSYLARFDAERKGRDADDDERAVVLVEGGVERDTGSAKRRERRQRLTGVGLEVGAALKLESERGLRPCVHDQHRLQSIELILVRGDVGARAQAGLLLAREECEADGATWRHSEGLQNARGFEHGCDPRPVVVGALGRVPRVEVGADQYQRRLSMRRPVDRR